MFIEHNLVSGLRNVCDIVYTVNNRTTTTAAVDGEQITINFTCF